MSIDVAKLTDKECAELWDKIARKSDVSNGWTDGFIRLVNTDKTKNNFKEIAECYCTRIPQMQRLEHFVRENKQVDEGAFFYVFNDKYTRLYEKMAAIEVLKCGNGNWAKWVMAHNRTFDIWARISFEFDVYAFGIDGIKIVVGERDPNKKVCRFCRETGKKYGHRAHAIPEAIGNKLLFCAEECNKCNGELKLIEENFIRLMDFRRAMYHIASKETKDSCTIKGKNYTIAPDNNGYPQLYIKQSSISHSRLSVGELWCKFNHYDTVVDQDIYRALAKMVIDLVPNDRLSHFTKTIDWIKKWNQDVIPDALPSVLFGLLPEGNMFEQPVLYLFFRREGETDMPYCTAMLLTTDVAYQFVMPYVDVDNGRFKYDDELFASRQRIGKYFNIQWEPQQYYSWWESNIWNYWPVDLLSSNIRVRPDDDPIFKKEKKLTTEDYQEFEKRLFRPDDIRNIRVRKISADSIVNALTKSTLVKPLFMPDKVRLNFRFDLHENKCLMSLRVPFEIATGKSDFSIELEADVRHLDRISCYDRYITGDTFRSLIASVWSKTVRSMNRALAIKARKSTIDIFQRNIPYDILRQSTIEFITKQGKLIKTSFCSVVE